MAREFSQLGRKLPDEKVCFSSLSLSSHILIIFLRKPLAICKSNPSLLNTLAM